jgi:hypothetical protein
MDNDKLFRLLDGDLPAGEIPGALAELVADGDARDLVTRSVLAADVIRRNSTPDDGFTLRILQKLEGVQIEPGYDPLKD